jgi:hypothetical protein
MLRGIDDRYYDAAELNRAALQTDPVAEFIVVRKIIYECFEPTDGG